MKLTKPSIDEQIEAVEQAYMSSPPGALSADDLEACRAAIKTLEWVKLKTKPALGSVMEAFPGAKVVSQDGEE
jgi:hypothetical protein